MEFWFTEKQTEHTGITIRVDDCLFRGKSPYQDVAIFQSPEYGKVLILDGLVMLTEQDEFVYHEMITHVPLLSHPQPKKVLIIGGGDGGTVREVLKHDCVEQIDLVEIDEVVIQQCKEHFPTVSCGLDSPKVKIHVADGIKFVKESKTEYDIIIIDSSDPIGPGEGLFTENFYHGVARSLHEDGIMVAQGETPFLFRETVAKMHQKLRKVFPITSMYLAFIPTYPSGCWGFAWSSKTVKPCQSLDLGRYSAFQSTLKYYNIDIHRASFCLPNFVRKLLADGNSF